jgi:AcrR family transcriptional regulator
METRMSRVTDAHIEARRKSILAAAVRVFASKGVAATTMAEIAEEAGLSAGAIYRYFESKQDLAAACFREGVELVTEQWRQQVEAAESPREAFYRIAAQSFEELSNPDAADHTRLMIEGYLGATRSCDEDLLQGARYEHDAIVDGLALILSRVKAAGQLPPAIDAKALAGALWSFWAGARLTRLIDPESDTDAQLAAVRVLMDAAGNCLGVDGKTG